MLMKLLLKKKTYKNFEDEFQRLNYSYYETGLIFIYLKLHFNVS